MKKNTIGLMGLGTMGGNLARNIASKGFSISLFNRHPEKVDHFLKIYPEKNLYGYHDIATFIASLEVPRKIILMVPAGAAVDETLTLLVDFLKPGDMVIDGGNSYFKDTIRRQDALKRMNVHFIGAGVSGGEEGALHGPSIMIGGDRPACKQAEPILKKIAARDFAGGTCAGYMGTHGAGHYVKMVHNGIEYAIMQMIAEAYGLLKNHYSLSNELIAEFFEACNDGKLSGYLMEIVPKVLRKKEGKKYLVDLILDSAKNKGTGKWTSQEALDAGVSLSSITQAVFARYISTDKKLRVSLSKVSPRKKTKPSIPTEDFLQALEETLYGGFLMAYAEGLHLLQKANEEYKFNLNMGEAIRVWQGGCIIRSKLLKDLTEAKDEISKSHMLMNKKIAKNLAGIQKSWIRVGQEALGAQIPTPALTSALQYYQSVTSAQLPANLIQGMRDFFGAHTYERIDKSGIFHADWEV